MLKLGKLPAAADARDLRYARYRVPSVTPPPSVNHSALVSAWGMLGNDTVGDCVIAGALHETLLWNREADTTLSFTPDQAIATYSAITGYVPGRPDTDRGTDMHVAAKYRRAHGVPTANPHKIAAFVALTVADVTELETAVWQFGAVGVGIRFPESAMQQFTAGEPWTVVSGSAIEGGHYVPAVGYDAEWIYVVTWGKVQQVARDFITTYNDESFAYLSLEALENGQTIDGFDLAALKKDLAAL